MENIYLIGFMGTGKSTVASALAEVLPCYIVDTDEAIERICNMSIPEIFEKNGEEYFRNHETMLLKELSKEKNLIVSCGGGMAIREENVKLMKEKGSVILLSATPETVLKRAGGDANRPLLKDKKTPEQVKELMDKRLPIYEAAKDTIIDTDGREPKDIASEIVSWLALNDRLF